MSIQIIPHIENIKIISNFLFWRWTVSFNVSWFGSYYLCCKVNNLNIPLQARSHDWPDHRWPVWKTYINKMWVLKELFLSKSFIFLGKIAGHWQRCEVSGICDRANVYWRCRSMTWPDLTWKWKVHNVQEEWKVSHAKFKLPWAALRSCTCGILRPCRGLLMTSQVNGLTWPENKVKFKMPGWDGRRHSCRGSAFHRK